VTHVFPRLLNRPAPIRDVFVNMTTCQCGHNLLLVPSFRLASTGGSIRTGRLGEVRSDGLSIIERHVIDINSFEEADLVEFRETRKFKVDAFKESRAACHTSG
jgi:hypothetical protein